MAHSCAWWVASQGQESWISPRNTFQRRLETGFLLLSKHTERESGRVGVGVGVRNLGKAEKGDGIGSFVLPGTESHLKGNRNGMAGPGQVSSHCWTPQGRTLEKQLFLCSWLPFEFPLSPRSILYVSPILQEE